MLNNLVAQFLNWAYQLEPQEVKLMGWAALVLISWLILKHLGIKVLFAFLFLVMAGFLLYKIDFWGFLQTTEQDSLQYQQIIEQEIKKQSG